MLLHILLMIFTYNFVEGYLLLLNKNYYCNYSFCSLFILIKLKMYLLIKQIKIDEGYIDFKLIVFIYFYLFTI